MGCVVVCAAGAGALDGAFAVALAALGFAVVAAAAVAVASVVLGYTWVLTAAVGLAIPPALWLLLRVAKHGPTLEVFRRHRRTRAYPAIGAARVPVALPRGTHLAIEQGRIEVTPDMVLGKAKEEAR